MGSILSGPKKPSVDPELAKEREAEKERLEKERVADERRKADEDRKRRANLIGARSLQDEEIRGFGGYRSAKTMGTKTPKPLKVD